MYITCIHNVIQNIQEDNNGCQPNDNNIYFANFPAFAKWFLSTSD